MKTGSGDTSRSRRNVSSSVQSTVRNVVTCGIAATSVSRRAISRRTGVMGSTPATSSVHPPARSRSSTVIRPSGPVPTIVARSIPRSFASLRTAGVAAALTGDAAASGRDEAPPSVPSNVTNGEPTGTASPTDACNVVDASRRTATGSRPSPSPSPPRRAAGSTRSARLRATSHATISPSSRPSPRSGMAKTRSAISTSPSGGRPRRSVRRSAGSAARARPVGTARPIPSRARRGPPGGRTPAPSRAPRSRRPSRA